MPIPVAAATTLHRDEGLLRWLWRCLPWPRLGLAAWRCGLLFALFGAGFAGRCEAQSAETLEYRVKAAFLCKFAGYVDWPPEVFARPDSPIVIGVIASAAVVDELTRTAAGLSAGARPLIVRHLQRGEPIEGSQVLYIAGLQEDRIAEAIAATKAQPVLVVTESSRAVPPGSVINFVVVDSKVRFDVAPAAAEARGLRISARLLSVARSLIGKSS
jgi:hypothetical protein